MTTHRNLSAGELIFQTGCVVPKCQTMLIQVLTPPCPGLPSTPTPHPKEKKSVHIHTPEPQIQPLDFYFVHKNLPFKVHCKE